MERQYTYEFNPYHWNTKVHGYLSGINHAEKLSQDDLQLTALPYEWADEYTQGWLAAMEDAGLAAKSVNFMLKYEDFEDSLDEDVDYLSQYEDMPKSVTSLTEWSAQTEEVFQAMWRRIERQRRDDHG